MHDAVKVLFDPLGFMHPCNTQIPCHESSPPNSFTVSPVCCRQLGRQRCPALQGVICADGIPAILLWSAICLPTQASPANDEGSAVSKQSLGTTKRIAVRGLRLVCARLVVKQGRDAAAVVEDLVVQSTEIDPHLRLCVEFSTIKQ